MSRDLQAVQEASVDVELQVRLARMKAAKADPGRSTDGWVAALAAGAGAELVARAHRARMILAERLRRKSRDDR